MPSFDVVSDFDAHEASNAVDQANREVSNRFDFKGTGSKYVLEGQEIMLTSQSDFQLKQMMDILRQRLSKRGIDVACMKEDEPELTGSEARQVEPADGPARAHRVADRDPAWATGFACRRRGTAADRRHPAQRKSPLHAPWRDPPKCFRRPAR